MKNLLFILILLISAIIISCESTNKPAKGFEDEIIVVADSLEYEQIVASLQLVFEKEIYTPQPEKLFTLKRMSVSQLEKNKRTKNIIIAAPLSSDSRTSQYIQAIVDSSVENKMVSDSNFVAYKYDLWAKNQIVAVISANTMQELNQKILNNSDALLFTFQKKSDERLFSNLYNPT
ncbi:MAG TPA: DUF4837 family protein, partial [Ignavibacteriaceae bacterium]